MGSLTLPTLLAGSTDDPATAIRPAGRLTYDIANQTAHLHNGSTPGGLPLAIKGETVYLKDRRYGVVGGGLADDTAAIQRCIDANYARTILVDDDVYRCAGIKFGLNAVGSENPAPFGLVGFSNQGPRFVAPIGFTGTMLQAWSLAATSFENFTVDGNNETCKLIDWDWKAGVGPSTLNKIDNIRAINCRGAIAVSLNDLNDTEPNGLRVETGGDGSKITIQARQTGGMLRLSNCQSIGGYADFSAQNMFLDHFLDQGIQFTLGGDNVIYILGGQGYGNTVKGAEFWTDNFDLNTGIRGFYCAGRTFPLQPGVPALMDLNLETALVELAHNQYECTNIPILGPRARNSSGWRTIVEVRGGTGVTTTAGQPALLLRDSAAKDVIVIADGVTDTSVAGGRYTKEWTGDFLGLTINGNTGSPINATGEWTRRGSQVSYYVRIQWSGAVCPANSPLVFNGLPFGASASIPVAVARGLGNLSGAYFDIVGSQIPAYNADESPYITGASGDITLSGTYKTLA